LTWTCDKMRFKRSYYWDIVDQSVTWRSPHHVLMIKSGDCPSREDSWIASGGSMAIGRVTVSAESQLWLSQQNLQKNGLKTLAFKLGTWLITWTSTENLKTHLKDWEDRTELMAMTMKSVNPMANKARIKPNLEGWRDYGWRLRNCRIKCRSPRKMNGNLKQFVLFTNNQPRLCHLCWNTSWQGQLRSTKYRGFVTVEVEST